MSKAASKRAKPFGGGGIGISGKKPHVALVEVREGFSRFELNILQNLNSKVKLAKNLLVTETDVSALKLQHNPYFLNLSQLVDTKALLATSEISAEISHSVKKVSSFFSANSTAIQPLENNTTKVVDELCFTLGKTTAHFSRSLYSDLIWGLRKIQHNLNHTVVKQPCVFNAGDRAHLDRM